MIKDRTDGRERNGDQDTDRSEDLSADNDGDQGDDSRNAERVTKEVRLNDITVDRLKNACKDNEDDRVHRIFDQKDKRAHRATDDRTEGRQDIRDTDDHRDKGNVRKARDQHEDRVGNTDTDRLDDRITDVFTEDRVASS